MLLEDKLNKESTINAEELELCMMAMSDPSIIHHANSEGLGAHTFQSQVGTTLWTEIVECDKKYKLDAPTLVRHLKHKGLWDEMKPIMAERLGVDSRFGLGDTMQIIELIRNRYMEDSIRSLLRRAACMNKDGNAGSDIISFLMGELPKLLPRRDEHTDIKKLIYDELNRSLNMQSRWNMLQNELDYDGLVILAARPSEGKTTFIMNEAEMWSRTKRIDFFSLEMSTGQLHTNMAAYKAGVNGRRIRKGWASKDEMDRFDSAIDEIKNQNLIVHEERDYFSSLKAKMLSAIINGGSTLVIVDYLQLIKATKEERRYSRHEYVNDWSSDLKEIYKRTGVPVVALSQISRLGNKQIKETPAPPTLEGLKDSGGIEQDADGVIILCKKPGMDVNFFYENMDWPMLVNVAKQRLGPTGMFEFLFKRERQAYIDPNTNIPEDFGVQAKDMPF